MAEPTSSGDYFKQLHERMQTRYKNGTQRKWRLSTTTNPFGANQLEEFGKKINEGVENVEIGTLQLDKFETIPTQHFHEIRRLANITGTGLSFHAPLNVDPAGLTKNGWSEEARIKSQSMLSHVMNRVAEGLLPNTKKMSKKEAKKVAPIPVVMHAGGEFTQQYEKGLKRINPKTGKAEKYEDDLGIRTMMAVNQATGEMRPLQHREKFRIGKEKKDIWDVHTQLRSLNQTSWDDEQLKIFHLQHDIEERDEKVREIQRRQEAIQKQIERAQEQDNQRELARLRAIQQRQLARDMLDQENLNNQIEQMNQNLRSQIDSIQDRFRKNPLDKKTPQGKQSWQAIENMGKHQKTYRKTQQEVLKQIQEEDKRLKKEGIGRKQREAYLQMAFRENMRRMDTEYNKQLSKEIGEMAAPKTWMAAKDFAMEKASATIAEAMFDVYDKQSRRLNDENMPFLALENFFPHTPMSTGKELKKTVVDARKQMAKKLVKEKKMDKKRADKIAEGMIGATWDMGHITALRQSGFEGKELKEQVLKQTRDVSKVVKHVHITDNFGWHDSHLAPGMGVVPIQEVMKELEEAGFAGTAVEESGGFISEFKSHSTPFAKEFFGSPIYGGTSQPNAYRVTPDHFVEFPQHHFNLYSSSFSTLPKVFGGQIGGGKSRFSNTPNQ